MLYPLSYRRIVKLDADSSTNLLHCVNKSASNYIIPKTIEICKRLWYNYFRKNQEGMFLDSYIYLIVAQTGTKPAQFFRFMTKKPYNHVSLSGDVNLSEMYSFCRTYRPFPLPATFNKEIVGEGTLGRYGRIPCEIYRIPVTLEQKREYNRIIKHFNDNRRIYSYNLLGLLAVHLNIEWNRKKSFVCSQFVAYTMSKIGIPLEKPFSLYIPDDFRTFLGATLIYTGELNTFYYGRLAESMVKRRSNMRML